MLRVNMEHLDVDKIVRNYLAKRQYDTDRYERLKNDPEFRAKNNERSRIWYEKNREKRLEDYDANKELKCAYQQFGYYRKQGRLKEFVLRFPQRWKLLIDNDKLCEEDKNKGNEFYFPEEPETDDEDPDTGEKNPNFIY